MTEEYKDLQDKTTTEQTATTASDTVVDDNEQTVLEDDNSEKNEEPENTIAADEPQTEEDALLQKAAVYHQAALDAEKDDDMEAALDAYKQQLELLKQLKGENSLEIADIYNDMAIVYSSQGDFEETLKCYQQSIAVRKEALGPDDISLIIGWHTIGLLCRLTGKYTESLNSYKEVLRLRILYLGENHPDTAGSYIELAGMYHALEDREAALENYQKATRVWEELHSSEALTATAPSTMKTAAAEFVEADQIIPAETVQQTTAEEETPLVEAEVAPIAEEEATIDEATGGNEKTVDGEEMSQNYDAADSEDDANTWQLETAACYNNMGSIYDDQGDYAAALENYRKALALRTEILGEEHKDLAVSYANAAYVCCALHDLNPAAEYYQKALKIFEREKGYRDPDTLSIYRALSLVYLGLENKGRYNYYNAKYQTYSKGVKGLNSSDDTKKVKGAKSQKGKNAKKKNKKH